MSDHDDIDDVEMGDGDDVMEEEQDALQSFWDLADACIQVMDFDGAEKVYREALKAHANDPDIMDALGDVLVQKGDIEQALNIFNVSIKLSPDIGADKYLNMGQLHEGQEALKYYSKALEIMNRERNLSKDEPAVVEDINAKMVACLVAMAEIYLTDECYADNAEEECGRLLTEALKIDPNNPEALQTMASYKISQQNFDAAKEFLYKSYSVWKDIDDLNALPVWNFRVQTAKLFIELEQYEPAADVLTQLNDEHDEDAEIWYLLGFSLNHFDPESALECLQKSKELLIKQKVNVKEIHKQVDEQIAKAEAQINDPNRPKKEDDGDDDDDDDDDDNDMDTA